MILPNAGGTAEVHAFVPIMGRGLFYFRFAKKSTLFAAETD